jgi:hypothetical protein
MSLQRGNRQGTWRAFAHVLFDRLYKQVQNRMRTSNVANYAGLYRVRQALDLHSRDLICFFHKSAGNVPEEDVQREVKVQVGTIRKTKSMDQFSIIVHKLESASQR